MTTGTNGIAIYVQREYAKQAYARESYSVRAWPGLEMIRDAIERAGMPVGYCEIGTVQEWRIILVSITSPIDWYSFISERVKWRKGDYTVIVGGAGNLNIRPVLEYADVFVFGRGENLIVPLVSATLRGDRFEHPAIAYADTFDPDDRSRKYEIAQADDVYPHEIKLANGRAWKETDIGCPRKCLFCAYTWQRRFLNKTQWGDWGRSSVSSSAFDERTLFDYDLARPDTWGAGHSMIVVGLDGMSERLRFAVNKPITDDMIRAFLRGLPHVPNLYRAKLFCVIGYPTETVDDWREFAGAFFDVDRELDATDRRYRVNLHCTPFKAMPATPSATWEMRYEDFRGRVSLALRDRLYDWPNKIFEGKALALWADWGIEGLPTIALWALMLRGVESDREIVRKLATSRKFQLANNDTRRATIEKYVDVDRLFRAYTWTDLPTAYLQTYVPTSGIARLSDRTKQFARYVRAG